MFFQDVTCQRGKNQFHIVVFGGIYGAILGALNAISYSIFEPLTLGMWTIIGAVLLAIFSVA